MGKVGIRVMGNPEINHITLAGGDIIDWPLRKTSHRLKLEYIGRDGDRFICIICPDGGIGRHEGLKILWSVMTVWVQVPLWVLIINNKLL